MSDPPAQVPAYGEKSKRKSRNLLYLLFGLIAFAGFAFALLHHFGQNFGVPV